MTIPRGGILALDLARNTGWAYGLPGAAIPFCGTWRLPPFEMQAASFCALADKLDSFFTAHGVKLLVLEAPVPTGSKRGINAARQQLGLAAAAEMAAHWADVRAVEENVSSARKSVLGRGMFPKGEAKKHVTEWCSSMNFKPPDDNAADALLLWFHTQRKIRI